MREAWQVLVYDPKEPLLAWSYVIDEHWETWLAREKPGWNLGFAVRIEDRAHRRWAEEGDGRVFRLLRPFPSY